MGLPQRQSPSWFWRRAKARLERSFSELACSIRFLLLADVAANLVHVEPDGGYRVLTSPQVLAREVAFLAVQSGATAMALFPLRNPITEATGYFGGMVMHIWT